MNRLGVETEGLSACYDDVQTPNEHDLIVSRLMARIAELEERLYKKELEAPEIGKRAVSVPGPHSTPLGKSATAPTAEPVQPPQTKLKDSILATIRESWAKLEGQSVSTPQAAITSAPSTLSGDATTAPGVPAEAPTLLGTPAGPGPRSATPLKGSGPNLAASTRTRDVGGSDGGGTVDGGGGVAGLLPARSSSAQDLQAKADADGDARLDDDDNESLSSVDSTGMGYGDTASAEHYRDQKKSDTQAGPRSISTASAGAIGDATPFSVPSTPAAAAVAAEAGGGRPPIPPGRPALAAGCRPSTDGVAATAGPAGPGPCSAAQQQGGGGGASRMSNWSGAMLSKLGLTWGRDRDRDRGERDGGVMARNGSISSLQQYHQSLMPLQAADTFSEKALEERLAGMLTGGGTGGDGGHYYRYVWNFDPADVQAEMEVTARVRRAAAEALSEANARLAEEQAAKASLQKQLEQAKAIEQELEQLRSEQAAAQAAKVALEDQMALIRRQLDGMRDTETSLQSELESMRSQADIWSSKSGEAEKLKQENSLLRSQLTTRLSELQTCRTRLSEGEAERQRLLRDAEELRNKIQWLTKINLQLETSASQLNDARKAAAEWQERFMRERNVRRRLHDQLQQLKGNIRVMCRVRPVQPGQRDIVSYPLEGLLAVSPQDRRYQEFEFDHVFPPSADQSVVFDEAVASLVRSVADGYNACIFAYGQTGSGKTHTMQGPPENPGVYVRALRELFRIATEEDGAANAAAATASATASASASARVSSSGGADVVAADGAETDVLAAAAAAAVAKLGRYTFHVSMLEIYNEAVHDLLAGETGVTKPLDVSGMGAGELPLGHDRVPGLTWRPVGSTEDVEALLREGGRNRATAATSLNAHSSRSHALLCVRVTVTGGDGRKSVSLLHLVDLAGSERVDKSEVVGQQLKEAQSINRSLSALGDVISALQRRSTHIPFRNSKLTAVLQDSLCGNSKVLLVCNIAPEATSASETLSSLNFASRAAQVELGAARRAAPSERPPASPSPHDRSPAPEREGGRGTAQPALPSQPPLPIMNGTAAKVRAQAAAAAAAGSGRPAAGHR